MKPKLLLLFFEEDSPILRFSGCLCYLLDNPMFWKAPQIPRCYVSERLRSTSRLNRHSIHFDVTPQRNSLLMTRYQLKNLIRLQCFNDCVSWKLKKGLGFFILMHERFIFFVIFELFYFSNKPNWGWKYQDQNKYFEICWSKIKAFCKQRRPHATR